MSAKKYSLSKSLVIPIFLIGIGYLIGKLTWKRTNKNNKNNKDTQSGDSLIKSESKDESSNDSINNNASPHRGAKSIFSKFESNLTPRSRGSSNTLHLDLNKLFEQISPRSNKVVGAHKSFETAMFALNLLNLKYPGSFEVRAFLDCLMQLDLKMKQSNYVPMNLNIISIEGLKSSGKTTLIKTLCAQNPETFKTVTSPEVIVNFDEFLRMNKKDIPEQVWSAYKLVKNYFMVNQIIEDIENVGILIEDDSSTLNQAVGAVVYLLEDFYHSTCANVVSSQIVSKGDFYSLENYYFQWPYDLVTPKLALYILVKPEPRQEILKKKLKENNSAISLEDLNSVVGKELEIEEKLQIAYSLIKGPPAIAIDGSVYNFDLNDFDSVPSTAIEAMAAFGVISTVCENLSLRLPSSNNSSNSNNNSNNNNNSNSNSPSMPSSARKRMSSGIYGALSKYPF